MEPYDILMLSILVAATVFGAIKGFAWQLAAIASMVVSYWVAYTFREPFSESIRAEPPWNQFLAMLILFVGTSLVIWIAFRMVSQTIDRLKLREFDRQVGAAFGLAKGALYCILITLFAVTLMGDKTREAIVDSRSGRYISRALDRSESVIPPEIHGVVQPYLEKFDQRMRDGSPEEATGGSEEWAGDRVLPEAIDRLPESLPDTYWDPPPPPADDPVDAQRAQQPPPPPWAEYQR